MRRDYIEAFCLGGATGMVISTLIVLIGLAGVRGVNSRAPGAVQSALPPPAITPVPVTVRSANPSADAPQGPTLRALFDALWMQEASQRLDPPDGDGGKAIGPYQIWRAYWIDSRMPYGTYADCRDRAYAEQVMRRYWRRYCPAALASLDFETLARTHNGGPRGATSRRAVTDGYWASVKRTMEEAK